MFSLFKKKQTHTEKVLKSFQDDYTTEQKEAILCAILAVGGADGDFLTLDEDKFILEIYSLLGYNFVNSKEHVLKYREDILMYSTLNSLNNRQKSWFATAILIMGKINNNNDRELRDKFDYIVEILHNIGIDEQDAINEANKYNRFSIFLNSQK